MDLKSAMHNFYERLKHRVIDIFDIARATVKAGLPFRFWPILLIVGVLLGVSLKWVAKDYVTIGYGDFRLIQKERLYDLNRLQEEIISEGGSLTQPEERMQFPSCSLYE